MNNADSLTKKDFTRIVGAHGESDEIVRPSLSYGKNVWRRLKKNKVAIISGIVVLIIILLTIFAPIFSQYNYETTSPTEKNLPPSAAHWFGTDMLGRDLWTRVWQGSRVSLIIGVVGAIIPLIIGIIIGGLSGYFGGMFDTIIMRIIDVGYCIPQLIYITFIMIYVGSGPFAIILAISITGWMSSARSVRTRVMQFKNREFAMAARTLGASSAHVIYRCILPNIMGQQVVALASAIPSAIFSEAYLSFIGLGIQSPMTSLGQLAQIGSSVFRFQPHQLFLPCAVIAVTILAFYLFANCLRDAMDPHMVD